MEISRKVQELMHVMRREKHYVGRRAIEMEIGGGGEEGLGEDGWLELGMQIWTHIKVGIR